MTLFLLLGKLIFSGVISQHCKKRRIALLYAPHCFMGIHVVVMGIDDTRCNVGTVVGGTFQTVTHHIHAEQE